jgi:ribonuclease R
LKKYIDLVLKKEKKPANIEKILAKIENLLKMEDNSFEKLSTEQIKEIEDILTVGVDNYDYILTPKGNYALISKTSFRKGKFSCNKNGDGFVNVTVSYTDKEGKNVVKVEKYGIIKEDAASAIDGDTVLIDIRGNGERPRIEKIIDRNLENITGEVVRIGNSYFVKPIDKKKQNLTIALEGEAIEGARVAVDLVKQTSDNFYIGEITRVFNHKDDPSEDILWEAFKCGIDDQFSKESLEQIKHIPNHVVESDKIGREDLTDWEIFTIDGEDTKDIDDALSCKKLDNGNYLVGVHIADVSNYVPENSPLDIDAARKGTSNYLAGKVIPMLPHELSNGICSLNPGVERLALSCIMEVSPSGEVVNYRITPTVIKSSLKMTYTKVNQILKENIVDSEYESHAETIRTLNKLALVLRKKRIKSGAMEFDRPELKLIFNEDGTVKDFSVRRQDLGENLIEEFMLLANETVDKHLSNNGLPCLHRIHDKPNEDRLVDFLNMLDAINLPYTKFDALECSENHQALQDLGNFIKDRGFISDMLSTNLVRCMSRAKYSPNNIGHSGLAKENYCHFTSPIRRYPDLTVHRILKDCCIDKTNVPKKIKKWEVQLPEIGEHSSKMERTADEAEQQTLRMKCSEYMEQHIGEEFEGTITGISDRGILVQLDNLVEGKVKPKYLFGDYVYNSETYTLLSIDGRDNYYIGDRLRVKVVAASKEEKTIDFEIVEKIKENTISDRNNSNQYVKSKAKTDRINRAFYKN